VKKIWLAIVTAAAMSALAATTAFALPSRGAPARVAYVPQVNWGDVAIPGQLCEVDGPIQLHNGVAKVSRSGFGPIVVNLTTVTHGYLGHPLTVAGLQIWCAADGTAASQLAEGIVVFGSTGSKPRLLGTLTPRYRPRPASHVPYIAVVRFDTTGHVATTEFWYTPSNPDCCPSGRAATIWKWTGHTFIPGRTKIISSH
jgi:hypothetical protein